MLMTANPLADAERYHDAAAAAAEIIDRAHEDEEDRLLQEVRAAILAGDAAAIVPHVSIAGKRVHAMLTEVMADHMHDQDAALLQLLSCAALGDIAGAAAAAETIISAVAHRHAEDVCEKLDLAGEVMA
jgi:hypothetical protein